jgi:hypothetical protein
MTEKENHDNNKETPENTKYPGDNNLEDDKMSLASSDSGESKSAADYESIPKPREPLQTKQTGSAKSDVSSEASFAYNSNSANTNRAYTTQQNQEPEQLAANTEKNDDLNNRTPSNRRDSENLGRDQQAIAANSPDAPEDLSEIRSNIGASRSDSYFDPGSINEGRASSVGQTEQNAFYGAGAEAAEDSLIPSRDNSDELNPEKNHRSNNADRLEATKAELDIKEQARMIVDEEVRPNLGASQKPELEPTPSQAMDNIEATLAKYGNSNLIDNGLYDLKTQVKSDPRADANDRIKEPIEDKTKSQLEENEKLLDKIDAFREEIAGADLEREDRIAVDMNLRKTEAGLGVTDDRAERNKNQGMEALGERMEEEKQTLEHNIASRGKIGSENEVQPTPASEGPKSRKKDDRIGKLEIEKGIVNKKQRPLEYEASLIENKLSEKNPSLAKGGFNNVKAQLGESNTPENKKKLSRSIDNFKSEMKNSDMSMSDKHNINKKLGRMEKKLGISKGQDKSIGG